MTLPDPVPAPWQNVALVCRKCTKKLHGGFGPKLKQDLSKVLRDELKQEGRRRALRIIEVGCLGLCPKRAVTLVAPGRGDQLRAIPRGADPAQILQAISPPMASS